jgi:uncharacterized membrane protein required for colicin V production
MTWVDLLIVAIIIGIAFLESKRGFGYAIFDLIGGIIALKTSMFLSAVLAESAPLGFHPEGAQGFWLAISFIVLATLALLASRLIYQNTLISLDVMDPTVGAILGIGSGLLVSYIVLQVMLFASAGSPAYKNINSTFMVNQIVRLHGVHSLINTMNHVGELPPPGSN